MKNEFIEQLGEALKHDSYGGEINTYDSRQTADHKAQRMRYKAARILHEIATNPDIDKALDRLCDHFYIDSDNTFGDWAKTHLERPATGETLYSHTNMTRKEIEASIRDINLLRRVFAIDDLIGGV